MSDLAECLRQIVGGVAIVFDDKETHDESAVSRISDVPRRGTVLDCTNHSGTISKCPGVGPKRERRPEKCEGRRFDPPPLNQLRTGGGDGCRDEVRRGWGRAPGPSPWFEPPAGATDADGAPHSVKPCRAVAQRTSSRRPTSPA